MKKYIYGDAGTLRGVQDGLYVRVYNRPTIKDKWNLIQTRKYTCLRKAKMALKRVYDKF